MKEVTVKCEDGDEVKDGYVPTEESSIPGEVHSQPDDPGLVVYKVSDATAPPLAAVFGLQQVLLSISSTISVPLIVATEICAGDLDLVKSQILSTFLFMCGISTLLQTTLGVRLPIIQGGCHKFIPAIVALMSLPVWQCPERSEFSQGVNSTIETDEQIAETWKTRMREIQGGIMTSAIVQVFIGCTGTLGLILRFVGPITILPTITLVGLSLIDVALRLCEKHWGVSSLTVVLVLLFSLYLSEVKVPVPAYSRQNKCHIIRYPIFKLVPVILAVAISWSVCGILTVTESLSNDPDSREYFTPTDARAGTLSSASWFFFPYPGQWGMPTVTFSGFMAMLTVTICSSIESVGDYYACARMCGELPPPAHAVNRGIAIEGVGSIISGVIGSGGASTSYSQNVGAIGFTKVASRRAFQAAGIIFMVCGICGKFGAMLTLIPDPVLGGILLVSFAMVTSVGLSNLHFVSLQSTRNLMIIGCSILIGLMIPRYLGKNKGCIQTGSAQVDQVLTVLLSTSMFVGGVIGFVLDITVPASRRAFQAAGIIFMVCGICGKFGAMLTLIPDPVLGGILLVSFAMVTSVGLSNLHFVSLQSTRNLMIIGCSILIGLMIPRYLGKNKGCIQTGSAQVDQVLTVLLSTSMFVGGVIGFVLDITVPGTIKERGIKAWRKEEIPDHGHLVHHTAQETLERSKIYDIPFITDWLRTQKMAVFIPFLPTFQPKACRSRLCCTNRRSSGGGL